MAHGFEARLRFVLNMQNAVRWIMYRPPDTPQGRFVNENTVLRLAAMMEAEEVKDQTLKPEGHLSENATPAEVSVRVLFLFRNLILHADGRLVLRSERVTESQRSAYRRFCQHWGLTCLQEGEVLCQDTTRVMVPLVTGCRDYYLEVRSARRRPTR